MIFFQKRKARFFIVKYIAIACLLVMSALFSSMETAFSTVNKIRLKHQAANGSKKAERALKIAENFDKALTTILVGNNIVNILSSSLGTVIFTELFGAAGVAVATAVMTVLVLIFGEIMPKSFAKQHAEACALAFSGILNVIMWILTPISIIFAQLQKAMAKLSKSGNEPNFTEDELKYIINEIEDQGVLEEQESELVKSALEFDETTIEQILVPRVKVVAVERNDDPDEIMEIFIRDRYTRLPVYDKSIDNIIGLINEKDFFKLKFCSEGKPIAIEDIIQKALYVSEMKLISEVLYEMQRTKIHMAIVKDQYGGTSGIVTMEDIIEELVGEIYDETDEVVDNVVEVAKDMYEIQADLSINDMLEELELPDNLIETDSNTVGGWVMELFGRIPEEGATETSGMFTVTILESDEQSVSKVGIKLDMPKDNSEE
ncbi:MAG: HlyC/CorC family transporter [Oscillospiraceae bacterium]|nr:HlyC/CorC family transporter [Oscillospiraceae bacterium]